MTLKVILIAVALFLVLSLILVVGAVSVKADDTVIDMTDFQTGDLVVDGFELKGQTRVTIHAIGAALKNTEDLYAYGWIIDADSREPVWIQSDQESHRYKGSNYFREFEGEITLPAGRYECYYYASRPFYTDLDIKFDDLGKALEFLGDFIGKNDENQKYYDENLDALLFEITAPAGLFTKFNPSKNIGENSIIEFSQPGNDYTGKKGFTLKKDLNLKIIAEGEYSSSDRVFVDYGWIINADSRKKVWQMDKWNTSWSGGARKNRGFIGDVSLPAGNYIACYVTDDSHTFGDWNSLPPYDPLHYGFNIYTQNAADKQYVAPYEDTYSEPLIISLTHIGNNAFRSKAFTLKKPTDLHIVAIGEYGYDDAFVDYGWIENIDDNDKVWEMAEENTEHAGGASKNRKFDGIVTLPAGNYMVYYTSDDSHSYGDWNATAPLDRDMWGITIFGAGKNFDPKMVEVHDQEPANPNILVNLTGIGDDADVEEDFKISVPEKVHIFALGEGRDGEMFDYGWIVNKKNGETVWEMTYRMTRHAGGADKNRKVESDIYLEPGQYEAHFETDDSHSFPDFNAARPDMPQKWGITITKK
ncbi:conserved exported hypothetical protein [Candidatus Zixiibacteriota bacterium]|nr:conserved exported hypothetical protein [candidate division Zixibacteria bacterium]